MDRKKHTRASQRGTSVLASERELLCICDHACCSFPVACRSGMNDSSLYCNKAMNGTLTNIPLRCKQKLKFSDFRIYMHRNGSIDAKAAEADRASLPMSIVVLRAMPVIAAISRPPLRMNLSA